MAQHIRRSQFVITWGPGAILEGPRGPRIMPRPDIALFTPLRRSPEDFEISDQRMSQGLLGNKRIFRLPSNAELGISDHGYIYHTKQFPEWCLCTAHWILYRLNQGCPRCGNPRGRGREAIRFVRACLAGHMDDIDWDYLVHQGKGCEASPYYYWRGAGGSLRDVEIECPNCHKRVNFGWAYRQTWRCSGRYPEREPLRGSPNRPGCSSDAQIIQRQASNLRVPEIVTLFTIPPRDTRLHRLLEILPIRSALVASPPPDLVALENVLKRLHHQNIIKEGTVQEILRHPWDEIQGAINDVLSPVKATYTDLIQDEFHTLIDASINGAPPVRGRSLSSPVLFEVIQENVKIIQGPNNHLLRIVPVSRLNTIVVQRGYRRLDPANGSIVEVCFRDDFGNEWLPGVEFLGEGIFIMLDDESHFAFQGTANDTWRECYRRRSLAGYQNHLFRDLSRADELHPVFVWWHTLSHLLIRVLCIDSGYSSATIRERIYLEMGEEYVKGGIILYAVQPGGDGTLGGLISLVPQFERILRKALEKAEICPNDPLCLEQRFRCGSYAGAACYGCLLVSETSCEHRNMWLDRRILLENPP